MEEASLMETKANLADESEDTQKDKYLSFLIGKEDYGIDIQYVTEIVVMHQITKVPDMPAFIKGVINLRGNVISVMDMRTRFQMEPEKYNDRTCIIIIDSDKQPVGLIVDSVKEVVDIPLNQIDPPPRTYLHSETSCISGLGKIGNEVKILLDVEKTISMNEFKQSA